MLKHSKLFLVSFFFSTSAWSVFETHLAYAGLIGISTSNDSIYSIDPDSGVATFLTTAGGNYAGVGVSFLDGELFATDLLLQIDPFIINTAVVDVDTGTSSPVGDQDGSLNWHGLASDENSGLLYSIASDQDFILQSMTASGMITSIGTGTGIDGRGMAFDDKNNILFATNSSDESLYYIDTVTGSSYLIGLFNLGIDTSHSGLAYDEENEILYLNGGVDNVSPLIGNLYSIDVTSGAATLIGSNGAEFIDSLAWFPDEPFVVPEPSTLALFAMGLAGLGFMVRRRRRLGRTGRESRGALSYHFSRNSRSTSSGERLR